MNVTTSFYIIDKSMSLYSSECLKRFVSLALKCCEDEMKALLSMLNIVRVLETISSILLESDTIPTESDICASKSLRFVLSSLYSRRNSYVSVDFQEIESNLVSGVIPGIKPRLCHCPHLFFS